MALKRVPYTSATAVVRDYLSSGEEAATRTLVQALRPARARGYLTPRELEQVCRWKSARAIRYIQSNSPSAIRGATSRAFKTRSERDRLEELTALRGVSVPMASAILMLIDPKRYGVIDIRVWQILHAVGSVTKKPTGIGFNFANWYQFLMVIRQLARKHGVKARDVERALFMAHKDFQHGLLYGTIPRGAKR